MSKNKKEKAGADYGGKKCTGEKADGFTARPACHAGGGICAYAAESGKQAGLGKRGI